MNPLILWAALVAGGATPNLSPTDGLEIRATATAGSGRSITGFAGKTYTRRSPLFLNVDVGFVHPRMSWLEFAPTLMLELEGRVAIGANPKLRALLPLANKGIMRRFRPFGLVGAPVFLRPYKLVGAQAGAGIRIKITGRTSLLGQATATVFFMGDDLMNNSALGKLDIEVGLTVRFQ